MTINEFFVTVGIGGLFVCALAAYALVPPFIISLLFHGRVEDDSAILGGWLGFNGMLIFLFIVGSIVRVLAR
jgi:hypothetical protein